MEDSEEDADRRWEEHLSQQEWSHKVEVSG